MPCNYKNYHPEWKSRIRPDILERDKHCCKFCKVPNYAIVCRGKWNGKIVWQNDDGCIFDATDGSFLGEAYVGEVFDNEKQKVTKVILTIAHLDHDKTNNDYENLAALCQKCHLGIDLKHHMKNARDSRNKKKKLQSLFQNT